MTSEILSATQYQQLLRINRYGHKLVDWIDYCPHEHAARCKRGVEWREASRSLPIPRHRSLVVVEAAQ